MRFSLSWLSSFFPGVPLPSLQEIEKNLVQLGIEVDAITPSAPSFCDVMVARVMSTAPHPQADRLQLATVSNGEKEWSVVCGAPNCRKDIRVAFAPVGAKLTIDGKRKTMKETTIRSVASAGMLCSEIELGLGSDGDGIIELPDEYEVGQLLEHYFQDVQIECSLTPNLGHCYSVYGIARELSTLLKQPAELPQWILREAQDLAQTQPNVTIDAPSACPLYCCRLITDVAVGPSPLWLKRQLESAGMRSINNITDITNFVLLELGTPLHAFDCDAVGQRSIRVRFALPDESLSALDGQTYSLCSSDVVIADGENRALALAGVIGGEASKVTSDTRSILLEAALFAAPVVQKTTQRLKLQTESSRRFARGVDPEMVKRAIDRAAMLMHDLAGGKVTAGKQCVQTAPFSPRTLSLRLEQIERLLGWKMDKKDAVNALSELHFPIRKENEKTVEIDIPSHRCDISAEIDLIEELLKTKNMNQLPKRSPLFASSSLHHSPSFTLKQQLRLECIQLGLQEVIHCDLLHPSVGQHYLDTTERKECQLITLLHSCSQDHSAMRPALLPGILATLRHNSEREQRNFHCFEMGTVYHRDEKEGYREEEHLAIALTGMIDCPYWDRQERLVDFFDLKGIVEQLFPNAMWESAASPLFHPGRQTVLAPHSISFGEIHPHYLRRFELDVPVHYIELPLALFAERGVQSTMKPLSQYPGSARDWTITLDEGVPVGRCLDILRTLPSSILECISLKAIYRDDAAVGKEKKNVTFHFHYRSAKRTLSSEKIDKEHQRILAQAESAFESL